MGKVTKLYDAAMEYFRTGSASDIHTALGEWCLDFESEPPPTRLLGILDAVAAMKEEKLAELEAWLFDWCPECQGKGYHIEEYSTENEHGQNTVKCGGCDGKGFLK